MVKISTPNPQHIHPHNSLLKTVRLRVNMMKTWCKKKIVRLKSKKKEFLSRARKLFRKTWK